MELIQTTVGKVLEHNATSYPSQEAAVYFDSKTRYTWRELNDRVNELSKAFIATGYQKGDHVAIWATNTPEWLITQFAVAQIGGVLITVNPEWKSAELAYALHQSDSKFLIMMSGFSKWSGSKEHRYDYLSILYSLCPELNEKGGSAHFKQFPKLKKVVLTNESGEEGISGWETFIKEGFTVSDSVLEEITSEVKPSDVAMIQYTSGTTGFPKGAMLTHYNIVNDARIVAHNMGLVNTDRVCGPVPYYHCFGSILFTLGCLVSGATKVVPSGVFDQKKTLMAASEEKCTAIYGVPTMFITEFEDPDFTDYDLSNLRTGIMAGALVEKELFMKVTEVMGARDMTIAYGLTEASPVTHQVLPSDPIEKRMSSVGNPIQHTEQRIVDPGSGMNLSPGEVGEIWVRGFHVMKGYYKKPEETALTIDPDGWLKTGDLGYVDEGGFLHISGRLKEMVIVGGHNVYPSEVEQAIHPMIEEWVEILQIVGIPHPKLQEQIAAVVKCRPGKTITLEQIKAVCDGKLEWPKIPRKLKIVDNFDPWMTVTGKIQKFKLKEMLEEVFA